MRPSEKYLSSREEVYNWLQARQLKPIAFRAPKTGERFLYEWDRGDFEIIRAYTNYPAEQQHLIVKET